MAPPARFTRHAQERIVDRVSMGVADVAAILDHDLALLVGAKSGHSHRLFFSPADEQCFVAIQDQENGDVVTVLPLDYHSSLGWEVSIEAQEEAELLLLGSKRSATPVTENEAPPGPEPSDATMIGDESACAGVFRIRCYVRTSEGQVCGRSLGSMPLASVGGDISNVAKSNEALAEIRARVAKSLQPGDALESAYVSRGRETVTIDDSTRWNLAKRSPSRTPSVGPDGPPAEDNL